jgi:hypothetical protein
MLATTTEASVRSGSHGVTDRAWVASIAALAAFRIAVPLVALASSGDDLPGIPRYDYEPLIGDANGFYATARELISAAAGWHGAVALGFIAMGAWAVLRLRPRWPAVAAATLAVSLAAAVVVFASEPAGGAVVGWPLLWAALLAPLRAVGAVDPDTAFAVGLVVSLLANAGAVVATAYIGLFATGRRAVGIGAAALLAVWPLLTRPLAGQSAWQNGSWLVDVGLALYTEPLSTALVVCALALVLAPRSGDLGLAAAGALLGFATVVKLSNGLLAITIAAFVVARIGVRRALPLVLTSAAAVPLVAAYWPKGYPTIDNVPGFSYEQAARSWAPDTLLFDPRTLATLLPLALLGAFAVRPWVALLLGTVIGVTALFYTFYEVTHLHPRFLYVSLPALFALEAAGGALAIRKSWESVRGTGL